LTGGSSSIPLVATKLAALGRIGVLGDPKTVVVQGALYAPTPAAVTAPAPAAHRRLGRPHLPASLRQRWAGHSVRPIVRRAITATAVGAALVAVVVGAVYLHDHKPSRQHTTTTAPTPALPLIAGTQLDALLLDAGDVNSVMGVTDMQTYGPITHGLVPPPGPPSACQSITNIADPSLYPGGPPASWNGWSDSSPQGGLLHQFGQAAVSMPSADAALTVVQNAATTWSGCSKQLITAAEGTATVQDSVGNLAGGPPKIWLLLTRQPANGWTCQHALSAVSNLIIHIGACGYNITDQAVHAADVIAAKATQ
jgi:serine/threonine kinase PknH